MQELKSRPDNGSAMSLARQLTDIARLLQEFWKSIDEAPALVESLATDCKSLSEALWEVARSIQPSGIDYNTERSLGSCAHLVAAMFAVTAELASLLGGSLLPMSRKRRKWKAIESLIREENLMQLRVWIHQARTILMLAGRPIPKGPHQIHPGSIDANPSISLLQNLYLQTSRPMIVPARHGTKGQMIAIRREVRRMASGMGNLFFRSSFKKGMEIALRQLFKSYLPVQSSRSVDKTYTAAPIEPVLASQGSGYEMITRKSRINTFNSITETKNLFGTVYFRTQRFRVVYYASDPESPNANSWEESEISFILRPAAWVCIKYDFDISRSTRELGNAIQPYQVIPRNSRAFDVCIRGDLRELQSMMSSGMASTRDIAPDGWSLLHVAAYYGNHDVCTWLLNEGAETDPRPLADISCASLVTKRLCHVKLGAKDQEKLIDLFRLFLDQVDIEDDDDPFWSAVDNLTMVDDHRVPQIRRILKWIARTLQSDTPYDGFLSNSNFNTPAQLNYKIELDTVLRRTSKTYVGYSGILKYILRKRDKGYGLPNFAASLDRISFVDEIRTQLVDSHRRSGEFDDKTFRADLTQENQLGLLAAENSPFHKYETQSCASNTLQQEPTFNIQELPDDLSKVLRPEPDETGEAANSRVSDPDGSENYRIIDSRTYREVQMPTSGLRSRILTALMQFSLWFSSPEIPLGYRRLVWTCLCGFKSYQDYRELEIGALETFADDLVAAGYAATATTSSKGPNLVSLYISNLANVIRNPFQRHSQRFEKDSLPVSESSAADITVQSCRSKECKWLHLCIKHRPATTKLDDCHLCHADGQPTYSDATVFESLRRKYKEKHNRWSRWLYILRDIKFVEFEVYPDNAVDHIQVDQIPPTTAPYDFIRTKYLPPVGSDIMMHHFRYPSASSPHTTWLSDKFPKKREEPLRYSEPSEDENVGWGLHYIDESNTVVPLMVMVTAGTLISVVFGTCYGILGKDMQDAWTIATWISSLLGLAVMVWQATIPK